MDDMRTMMGTPRRWCQVLARLWPIYPATSATECSPKT